MSHRFGRRAAAIGLSGMLAVAVLGATAGATLAQSPLTAILSGDAVLPGPGAPLTGGATITVEEDFVCISADIPENESLITAVGIYEGTEAEENGVLLRSFSTSEESTSYYEGCVIDPDLGVAISEDPSFHYLEIATADFPNGAVRGQLRAGEEPPSGLSVSVSAWACPGSVRSMNDIPEFSVGTCVVEVRTGDLGTLPAGYRYDPKPVEYDLSLTVTDASGTRALDEADREGGSTCNPSTKRCSAGMAYLFNGIATGDVAVRQVTLPQGYGLLGVRVYLDGDPAEASVDTATRTVTVNAETGGTLEVLFFDTRGRP